MGGEGSSCDQCSEPLHLLIALMAHSLSLPHPLVHSSTYATNTRRHVLSSFPSLTHIHKIRSGCTTYICLSHDEEVYTCPSPPNHSKMKGTSFSNMDQQANKCIHGYMYCTNTRLAPFLTLQVQLVHYALGICFRRWDRWMVQGALNGWMRVPSLLLTSISLPPSAFVGDNKQRQQAPQKPTEDKKEEKKKRYACHM